MCVCQFLCVSACIPICPPLALPLPIQEVFRKVKGMLLARVLTSEKQLLCVPTEGKAVFLSVQGQGRRRLQTQRRGLLTTLCPEQRREASLRLCVRAGEHMEVTYEVRWSGTHL